MKNKIILIFICALLFSGCTSTESSAPGKLDDTKGYLIVEPSGREDITEVLTEETLINSMRERYKEMYPDKDAVYGSEKITINLDSADAKKAQDMLDKKYEEVLKVVDEAIANKGQFGPIWSTFVLHSLSETDEYLSFVVTTGMIYTYSEGVPHENISLVLDKKTGKLLSQDEILDVYDMKMDDLITEIEKYLDEENMSGTDSIFVYDPINYDKMDNNQKVEEMESNPRYFVKVSDAYALSLGEENTLNVALESINSLSEYRFSGVITIKVK